ncbi:MAG: hypothetical protein K2K57_06265 [Oscillospiraceae bacterium]|nr:hypothetical protein [Oscillospiraceae bacterium]
MLKKLLIKGFLPAAGGEKTSPDRHLTNGKFLGKALISASLYFLTAKIFRFF